MDEVKTLSFDTSVSSMEYMADGEILVITYGKTVAFYDALRSTAFIELILEEKNMFFPASWVSVETVQPCFELARNRIQCR